MTHADVGSSESASGSTDDAVLRAFLSLQDPRLTLDVRPDAAFHQAHLANSYHIHPISKLKSRYSYLPPRDVPFLVLADYTQHEEVQQAFESTASAELVFLSSSTSAAPLERGRVLDRKTFFSSEKHRGLLRTSRSHRERLVGVDVPELLFRPSNATRRIVLQLEHDNHDHNNLRVLDLGCGAARDLAWILHGSRVRLAAKRRSWVWSGIGVDSWKAALGRASQLMDDLYLHPPRQSTSHSITEPRCESLLWAACSDDGHLEPLVGTGKGKVLTNTVSSDVEQSLISECVQLGLAPLLPAPLAQKSERCSQGDDQFDLILSIRFHPRALLPRVSRLVRTGGIVLLSHFVSLSDAEEQAAREAYPDVVVRYDSPPHEGRIQPGEVEDLVEGWNASVESGCRWTVAEQVLEPIEDGRIVQSVALRKVAL